MEEKQYDKEQEEEQREHKWCQRTRVMISYPDDMQLD